MHNGEQGVISMHNGEHIRTIDKEREKWANNERITICAQLDDSTLPNLVLMSISDSPRSYPASHHP